MTYSLLHINDIALYVKSQDSQLSSPGFALIKGNEIAFGDTALNMHRLYPLNTHNNFWVRFDQNPIQSSSKHIRHNADLAFMHLSDIHEKFKHATNWLVAVPSNYGENELALLLGLLNSAKFTNVKLIDAALLASSLQINNGEITYIDLQLHQTVLTRLNMASETRVIDSQTLQNVNMLSIEKTIEKIISDELISQSRFDSHHSAETEQLLYNKLPEVILALAKKPSYELEIEYQGHTHQAIINQASILDALTAFYNTIYENIDESSSIFLNYHLHSLPGCKQHFNEALHIQKEDIFKATKKFSAFITSTDDNLNYLSSLPKVNNNSIISDINSHTKITHVLIDNHATALKNQKFDDNYYSIYFSNNEYWLKTKQEKEILINGIEIKSDTALKLGDEITIATQSHSSRLICVD